jgi:hypothetical protein
LSCSHEEKKLFFGEHDFTTGFQTDNYSHAAAQTEENSHSMSDSGEEDAGGKGEQKSMLYKIKALKRRTVHAVAKNLGKAEQTKDPEFDVLYER